MFMFRGAEDYTQTDDWEVYADGERTDISVSLGSRADTLGAVYHVYDWVPGLLRRGSSPSAGAPTR